MPSSPKFLVVDDNTDSRFLLVKTLLRKFPKSVVQETQDAATASELAASDQVSAIVVHRAVDIDGVTLVRLIRDANPVVPIVMVSGIDRSKSAVEAGATAFLNYDAWLRIGSVVAELLEVGKPTARDLDSDTATSTGR